MEKASEASLTPPDTEASKCGPKVTVRATDAASGELPMRKFTAYGCNVKTPDRGVLDGK